jgi:hypothetical protein
MSIRLRQRRLTKIQHDIFIFLYFVSAPFDMPPLAGGREEMVSLLEEGLREVTNINYHIFIILKRVFYLSKSSPQTESDTRQSHQTWIPLQRGKCFF